MAQVELIDEMADIVLDKLDPIKKYQRSVSPARMVTSKEETPAAPKNNISPKRETTIRDQGQCTYVSPITNQKCGSTFQIEIDHVQPKALGGETTSENLRLLCKAHNQRAAIEIFGLGKMSRYLNGKDIQRNCDGT